MRLEVYEKKPVEGDVVRVQLTAHVGRIELWAVDEGGKVVRCGRIGILLSGGLALGTSLNPALGFPLDDKGRIKLVDYS